jgi:hypothetical protein
VHFHPIAFIAIVFLVVFPPNAELLSPTIYSRQSGIYMDVFVKLLVGISWPAALVWIAYLFKGELRSLLHRMSQLKYKDIEAKFDSDLADAEAKAVQMEMTLPPATPHPEISSKLEQLRRIADVSPRAAIMEAWVLIESAAGKSGFVQGAATPRINPYLFAAELVKLGKLPEGSDALLKQMRNLRNQAVHLPDFSLTRDEADRYLQLASQMSGLILDAADTVE